MGRLAGWEAFVRGWVALSESVSGVLASARPAAAPLGAGEAARLDVVIKKALRAKEILQALQEAAAKQEELERRFAPAVRALPALAAELRPEQLAAAAEFAATEGMRAPLLAVTGGADGCVSAAQASDPYGIRCAFAPGHPLALLSWRGYLAIVTRMARTVEHQLQGPALEALAAFNGERRRLVQELQALRQQLEAEVEIPQLQPLRDETERLDQLLQSLAALQAAHVAMLRKDLGALDLELLEARLKLKASDAGLRGSPLGAALARLKALRAAVAGGAERLPHAAWEALDADLRTLADGVEQRQRLQQQLDVNVQRFEQQVFRRLAQLRQPPAARDAAV
ncbi:hypothetical protein HT031_000788 [Scenedesmus sp. PABB004]|nr:hypothetical protein HT031_000788 [Scenedesmus sp. PABB004]